MKKPPNTRVQRTRSSSLAHRSPLTRCPLGGQNAGGPLIAGVLLALFVLFTQDPTVARAQAPPETYLWSIGAPGGSMREYSVPSKDLAQVAQWDPEKALPPLPIAHAVSVAKKALKADHPEWRDDEALLWSVQLQQAQSADYPHRWFYVFSFYRMMAGQPLPRGEATVVVLMNAAVVKPKTGRSAPR